MEHKKLPFTKNDMQTITRNIDGNIFPVISKNKFLSIPLESDDQDQIGYIIRVSDICHENNINQYLEITDIENDGNQKGLKYYYTLKLCWVEEEEIEIEEEEEIEDGKKYDKSKIRYDLIPSDSLHELAKVYTHGSLKYGDNNWRKGISWERIMGAMERHYNAFKRGQEFDPDSGLPHLAQVAWGAFTLLNYGKTHPELDTRVKDLGKEDISEYNNGSEL